MELETIFALVPKGPEIEYETKRGRPGIQFKFGTGRYYVTVSVTGTKERELPTEVATVLAAWSLSVLARRAA